MLLSLIFAAVLTAPALPDSVVFVPLREHSTQRDCGPDVSGLCRIRYPMSGPTVEKSLAAGIDVIRHGDSLTFLHRSQYGSVELSGGLQYPMSRIAGTDLWVITLHVPNADSAVVSYSFFSSDAPMAIGTKIVSKEWRGPNAPRPAIKSDTLHGTIRVDTLASRNLGDSRGVVTYLPPARGMDAIAGVVYLGDGGAVHGLAPYLDTLIVAGRMPRILLVGVPNGMPTASDPPGTDIRAMEYLWGFEPSNAHFLAHERFILEEVIPWAERTVGAPANREQRAVWGISNSGGWAISMGLRHPETLGAVLAFSPGGSHGDLLPGTHFTPAVRFFLQGGTLEPAFGGIAATWADTLRSRALQPELRRVVAGHDWLVWCESFTEALRWAFVRDDRRR